MDLYAGARYNMAPPGALPASPDVSAAANGAVTSIHANIGQMSAGNPALWLLLIGAATIGLIGFSVHGHVGPASASVSV